MDRAAEVRRMLLQALADLKAGRILPAQAVDLDAVAKAMLQTK